MRKLTRWLPDSDATSALGAALADAVTAADVPSPLVLLSGELGAGKSTLARAFLRRLGVDGPVPSPTYTLIEPYDCDGRRVTHLDLYRLADESELEFLDIREVLGSTALIEWPERAPSLAGRADVRILLQFVDGARSAQIEAMTPDGDTIVQSMQSINTNS